MESCENCFVPLINSKECWERVVQSNADVTEDVATEADFEDAIAFLQKEGGKSPEESYFSVFKMADKQVACPQCATIYCSEACRKTALETHHSLLCAYTEDNNTTAMGHFINHTLGASAQMDTFGFPTWLTFCECVLSHERDLPAGRQGRG